MMIEKAGIDNLPHIARRREGKDRSAKEIDDILTVTQLLDERKLTDRLPRYAADDPADLPSLHMVDGDMYVILDKLAKLEGAVAILTTNLNAVHSKVHASVVNTYQQPRQPTGPPGAYNHPAAIGATSSSMRVQSSGPVNDSKNGTTGWSTAMEQQYQSDCEASGEEQHNELPFSVVLSRSARRAIARANTAGSGKFTSGSKRRHGSSMAVEVVGDISAQTSTFAPVTSERKKKRHVVIGCRNPTESNDHMTAGIIAAEPRYRKAVFCIDNVLNTSTEEELETYIKDLGIHVLSVFKVQSRLSRREVREHVKPDRCAFRVCIVKDDSEKILDASNWPSSITVSEWYFRPQQTHAVGRSSTESTTPTQSNKKLRRDGEPDAGSDVTITAERMDLMQQVGDGSY
jgi:hypothetical protein